MTQENQLNLFEHVTQAYAESPQLDNASLYQEVARRAGVSPATLEKRAPVGKSGKPHSPVKRRIRWVQQTLKQLGMLERAGRGIWQLTQEGRSKLQLSKINQGHVMLAFSTDLGIALWADCQSAFARTDTPIHLCLTSPPYPLSKARAYGNPSEAEYVDFLCRAIEPIVRQMAPGGSLVLNLSNDIFMPGSPSRSLYRERLVLALADRFDLHKMDEIPWVNKSKPPGPVRYASLDRTQLNVGWEAVYWFTNDPARVRSDNRRVLQDHSPAHRQLMERGGESRSETHSDGAYQLRSGRSFSKKTLGKIPKNVLEMGHGCRSQSAYKQAAREAGLPAHGAPFPLRLAEFFIRFLTTEGDLVVDPFGGSLTTALAAERLGRHWIATEVIWEYLAGSGFRFSDLPAFAWQNNFLAVA